VRPARKNGLAAPAAEAGPSPAPRAVAVAVTRLPFCRCGHGAAVHRGARGDGACIICGGTCAAYAEANR
jgi:hypothetical protein